MGRNADAHRPHDCSVDEGAGKMIELPERDKRRRDEFLAWLRAMEKVRKEHKDDDLLQIRIRYPPGSNYPLGPGSLP